MTLLEKGNTPPTHQQEISVDSVHSTNTSKYETTLSIPPEFPAILRDFAKEILRNQPSNVYSFAVQYFTQKMEESNSNGTEPNKEGTQTDSEQTGAGEVNEE